MCTHKMATWNILDDNRLSLLHHITTSPSLTFTQTTPTLHVAQTAVSPSNSSSVVQQGSSRVSGDLHLFI